MMLPENIWDSKVLKNRFLVEAGFEGNNGVPSKAHYWLNVPEGDTKSGAINLRNYEISPFNVDPHEMQKAFAEQVRKELQTHEDHDGLWVVGWTHPPSSGESIKVEGDNAWGRLIMIWLDGDADPQFTLESEMPCVEIIKNGTEYYANLAATAHDTWGKEYGSKVIKDDMDLGEDQLRKAALETMH